MSCLLESFQQVTNPEWWQHHIVRNTFNFQSSFLVKDHATITPNRWPKDTWFKGCSVSAARFTLTRLEKRESKSMTGINYLQKNRPPLFQHVGTPLALEQSEVYSMWFQFLHTKGERGNTHKTIQNLAYLHFPV